MAVRTRVEGSGSTGKAGGLGSSLFRRSQQTQLNRNPDRSQAGDNLQETSLSARREESIKKKGVTESHDHQSCRNAEGQSVAVAPETLHVTCGSRSDAR